MSSTDKVSKWRANLTEDKKKLLREADRDRKAKKRASMTEEEKNALKERDRLRKAMKKTSQVDGRTLPRDRPWLDSRPAYDEAAANREYKRRVKESKTEEEHEFQRIQNIIIKRNSRAKRTTERKEEDKAKANEGMKKIKDMGHLMKFKVRRAKGEGEEYMWWKYWNKGGSNKDILTKKLPKLSAKFQDWDQSGKSPYDGVIDTDPDPNMTEDERFVFNRHGHLTKIKAIRKKNEEILQMNDK